MALRHLWLDKTKYPLTIRWRDGVDRRSTAVFPVSFALHVVTGEIQEFTSDWPADLEPGENTRKNGTLRAKWDDQAFVKFKSKTDAVVIPMVVAEHCKLDKDKLKKLHRDTGLNLILEVKNPG